MTDKAEQLAEAHAAKRCEIIRKRRELGMPPYSIHEAIIEDYLAAYEQGQKDARRWISGKDEMPKIGDEILMQYPLPSGKYSWIGGVVDGSDDGLFVDFDLDGEPITTNCYWFKIPEAPQGGE